MAAVGLARALTPNTEGMLNQLDDWAAVVKKRTEHATERQLRETHYPEFTDSQFRIALMVTVLQRDFGVSYNRSFSQGQYDARDSRNLFLHGPLSGFGGTCCTMPVLYAAIGRRLGYPIRIAFAKKHAFCRWEGIGGERFNIEATSPGFVCHTDDFYREWPEQISDGEIAEHRCLQSLSAHEERAWFLTLRGNCLMDNGRAKEALACYEQARDLVPCQPSIYIVCEVAMVTAQALEAVRLAPDASKVRVTIRSTGMDRQRAPEADRLAALETARILALRNVSRCEGV